MGTKKYVKPDIREDGQILTVRAWVTQTQYVLSNPTTATNVSLQEAVQAVSETNYVHLNTLTQTNVALQTAVTQVNYALQNIFQKIAK